MKTDDLITLLARQPDALPAVHPRRDWVRASIAGLGAAFLLMAVLLGPRSDLSQAIAEPLFLQKVGALALMVALAGWAAFRAGLPGRDRSLPARARWIVPTWLAIAALGIGLATPADERLALFLSPSILMCLGMVPVFSVLPALALGWALRRAAPTDPRAAARALGWAAGSIGAFAYAFHCQSDQPGYVLLWYGLAVAFTVLLTQAIATRWLRW